MAITCALGTKHIEALAKVIYKKMSTLPQGEVFDINGYMDYLYTKLAEKQGVDSALQYMQQFPYLANIIAAKLIDVVDIDPSVNLAAMAKAFRNPDTGWQEVNARFNRELTPEVLDAVSDYEANTPTQEDYEDEVPTPIAKVSDDRLKASTALSGTLEQFITMNPNDKFEGVVETTDPNKTYIRLALAKIRNLARNLDINATINYQGKFLRLKVVNLKDFPRDERTKQTDDLIGKMIGIGEEESIKNDVTPISQLFALMLTDESGNTIYFNQQGDVTTKEKGGKPVYQMMRDVRLQNGKYTVRDIYNKEDQIMKPIDLAYEMLRFMGYGSVSAYEKNENASFADLVKDLGKQQQEEFKKLYDLKQQALKGKAPLLFVTGASTGILNDVIKQDVKLSDLEGLAPNTIDTFLVLNKDEYGFRSGASIITVDDQSFQVDRTDIPKDISKQIAQALQSKTLKTKEKIAFYNQFFNDNIVNLQSKINNQDFSFVTATRRHKLIQKNNKLYFVYADYTYAELEASKREVLEKENVIKAERQKELNTAKNLTAEQIKSINDKYDAELQKISRPINTLRYVPLDGSKQSTDKIQEVLNGGKASVKEGKVTKYGAKMNYMNGILNSDFFTYDETTDKLVKSGTYKEFIVGLNPKILLSKSQGLPLYNSYLKFAIPDAYSNKAAKAQQRATEDSRSEIRKFKDNMVEVVNNAPAKSIKIKVTNVTEKQYPDKRPSTYNYDATIEGQEGTHRFYNAQAIVHVGDTFYLVVEDIIDGGFLFKDAVKAKVDTQKSGTLNMGSLGERDFKNEDSRGIPIETITAAETEEAEALDELKPEPNTVPDEDIEGDQKELLNPDNTIQPSDSTPISRRLKRDYSQFKLDRSANLSNDVTQEQIDAATIWWNNSPLSKFISLEQVANIVNSNVYARFIAAGSSLLAEQNLNGKLGKILINQATKGSMVDTYHEAWHVFSQLFLTREEKLKLYNEVRNSDPKFKNLSARAIEEVLAEDFRTYALSPKTKKGAPVRNTLFRRILNFLKKLFSRKQSLADQIQPEEISTYGVAGELFNKLYFASNKPELLNDYVPLIDNVQWDMLNRGIRQQRAYREDALNERDSLDLVNAMDSMISEEIDNAYAYQKESNGATANKSGTVNIILRKENEAQLYEFLKENLEDRVAEIKNRLTVAPVKPFNDINTLVDLSTNAVAVIKNSKGDNEYFFLRDQIEDFDNLTLDNKEGQRIKGELYKGTIDVIGDFYTHNKIKGSDKTPANIVIVNSLEEAKAQFEAYVKAKETDYTEIVENPNASATQAVLDFDQQLDLERLRIFQTALKNWNKTIKFHKENSDFNIINKKVRLQESDPALDPEEATNDIEDATGGEKLKDSVGDVTLQQLADNEVIYMLKSLFALDKDGNHQYDRLGFKKRASFKKVWNALVRSTGSTKDPQEIYNKIVAASAIYPELKQLVEYKLPNPSVEDPINGTSFSITTSFWNAFSLPRIKYIQLLVVPEKDGTTTEVVGTSMDIGSTKRKFTSQFKAQKPNKFISKDKFNNNILNLNAIVQEFIGDDGQLKTGDNAEYRFLKAIGFNYDDLGKIKQTLSDKIIRKDYALGYIFTAFKELRDAQVAGNLTEEGWEIINRFRSNPIDALSRGFNKGIIGAPGSAIYLAGLKLSTAVNKLIELQNKYGATSSNFSVLNAAKKRVNEHTTDNTLTVIADALNTAKEKTDLFRKGSITSYLDPSRNPWTNNLQTFNSLFDASNKKRVGRSIVIEMASGTQILGKDGSTTTDLDPRSKFIQEFHTMLKAGMQEVLRPGSKSSSFAWRIDGGIEFPGIGTKEDKHLYIDFDTFLSMNNELDAIEKIILPYVSSETARINIFKSNPEAKNYIGYNKPGKDGKPSGEQFNYFDGVLSKETKQEILSKVNTTEVTLLNYLSSDPKLKETIIKEIQSYFEKKSNKLYDYLNEAKYIDPKLLNKYNIPGFTGSQKERLLTKTYMYNSWIHNLETSVIFYGDIAQYDHPKQGFHKRTSGLISNGRRVRTDVAAIRYINEQFNLGKTYASTLPPKYNNFIYDGSLNTAVIEEIKRDSVYIPDIRDGLTKFYTENTKMSADEIKKTVDREVKKYTKEEIKEGDGQGYITFDAYRTLKRLQNKWSIKQEDLFQKIIKGEPIEGPLDEFFPVYKLQNFGFLEDTVLPVTAFHKFALFPLIPSVIKEGSDFDKLHKKMLEQNIQYVTFESGSKVGAVTSNGKPDKAITEDGRFNDSVVFTKNTFNAGFLKEVTNVPNKYKGKVVFSTQLRKLILDGLYEEGALTLPKYSGLVKAYEESVKFNTELLKEELKQEIGYDETKGITNPEKFLKVIKDNLQRKDYPEHLLRALKTNSDGSLKYDLSYFLDAQAIEDTIMSIVEKKFVRQKVKGEALVQVASSFTNNMWTAPTDADIKKHMGSNTLPFYHPGKDGKTNAMKVAIALQGDFYHLLKLKHLDGEVIGTIQRLNEMIKDDKWLDTDNNRKSITMTAVRIPVQGLNSMEFMEVYEFLDPSASSIIIVPTELVAKSGGDFDVDKLTTFMPNINSETGELITSNLSREEFFAAYNKATDAEKKQMLKQQKKVVENSFIENIRSILEIPENYATLVKPNDTALLQGLSEELEDKVSDFDKYEKVNGEEVNISGKGTKMISPTTVLEQRYNVAKHGHNIVGKAVLGIAASENAMNPVFNQAGVILPKKYKASEFNRSLSKYVEFGEPIYDMRLFLPHNKTKSGNISLSKIYDEAGIDRIADVVSQGMNGWVDVEANEWIFYIQGNYELAPTMLYLIRSGVPREYAVKFVSSPLIREFAEELRKISGPFAGAMGIAAKEKAFERYEATKRVIDRHMREYYNASISVLQPNDDVTVYYKTFVPNQGWIDIPTKMKYSELRDNINGLIYDLNNVSSVTINFDGKEREVYVKPSVDNKLFYNASSKANERYETSGYPLELMNNLIDSYAKTGTIDQNQIIPAMGMLLHFSEIQKQIQGIGRMKRRSKPDTTLFRNIQEIALRDLDIDSLDTLSKVDKASKDRILYESITSSLGDKKLIVDVVSQMLPLRNGEPTDKFIKTALSDEQYKTAIINKFGASNDGLVNFVNAFKNDITNFILQNYLSNFIDANGSIVKIPTEFKEMPVKLSKNLSTDVEIKDGVVYVNSQNLREDFANKSYLDIAEGPRSYAQRPGLEPFKTEQDPFASEEAYIKYAIFRSYMQTKGYTGLELNKIALLNSFNYNALMRNNDYSYTNEVMDVIQKYPNLAIDYPILEQISIHSTSKSTEFNVLTLTDRDVIDAATKDTYARNIRALGNESVQKVEDTKENLRISRLFHMLPLVAIYQHGVGSTLYGFDQVLPQDMVQSAMQNASNLFKLNYWNFLGLIHVFYGTVSSEQRQFKNFVVTEDQFNAMPEIRAVAAEEDPFEAIENAPVAPQPVKITLTNYTNHSGGALGADTEWDVIGKKFGMTDNKHYWMNNKTPNGNTEITADDAIEGQEKVTQAARAMGRIEPTHQVRDERLIRNWSQVKYSDAVFAVTTMLNVGAEMNYGKKAKIRQGKGGTGYAIEMAIQAGKPVYVFDQVRNAWFKNIDGKWSESEVPTLTQNFAGIGTREINEAGKKAIRDVYAKTLEQQKPTTKPAEVKSGVQEIFESNPELSAIGSQEQYSQYLNNRFPNSQIKDILYHGTSAYKLGDTISDFQNRALYLANKSMAKDYAGKTGVLLPVIINSQVLINSPELIGELPETLTLRKEQLKNAKLAEQNKGVFAVNRGMFRVDDIVLGEQDIEYYLTKDAYSNRNNQRFEALTGEDLTKFIKFLENRISEIEAGRPIDSFITRADGDPEDFYGVFNPKNVLFLGSIQDIEGFRNFVKNLPVVNQSTQAKTTDDYRYFGSMYTIKLQDGVGVDVEGYKGKAAAKQKLLDAYNTNPNVDPQNGRPFRETPTQLEVQAQNSGNKFVFADGIAIDVPFTLNAEQQAALYKLEDFYNNPAKYQNEITLSGYAGTGKTTILGVFDKYLKNKTYVKPIYTSPTHRANAVTKMKNPKANVLTLHKLFGLNPMLNLESDQLDIRDVKTESVKEPKIKRGDTIIVDESSMVTNELYDLIQEFKDTMNLRIIFAGDRGQLGPVQNDTKLQSKVFDNPQNQAQLTKVERTGDNPILLNSTRAREGQDFTYITDEIDGNGVEFFDTPDRLNQIIGQNLKEMMESGNMLYFRILSSLNKDVAKINVQARQILFGEEANKSPYIKGDILMGYDNIGEDMLINSGDYVVEDVSEEKDLVVNVPKASLNQYGDLVLDPGKDVIVKGYRVTIKDILNPDNIFSINVPSEGNDAELVEIATRLLELKGFYSRVNGRARGRLFGAISAVSEDIVFNRDIKDNGRFLAKKALDYGYAHTIHKSQGGTYNKVLIFDDSISSLASNLADKRKLGMDGQKSIKDQLKYVAISRASEYAYVYNPKDTAVGGYDFRGETPQPITEEDYDTAAVATFSFATVEEKPTPAVPTKGEIELRSDNVDKVFSGNKTITNRTSLINDGKYSIKGSTDVVEIKYIGKSTINGNQVTITNEKTGKVSTRTLDQLAKAEGFKDAADFKANNKFSTNYLNGTQSRYLYQITPVFAVSADAEASMGRINPETSTDLQEFRDAVAQNNNIFPAKFTSAAGRVYVLNSDGLYNLVDPLSGTTLMKNIDLTTGEMGVPSNVNVPATNAYKNELLKQIQTYIKDFNLEEILGQYGYDVKDLIEKVQNAETQDQVDEVAALINEKICKS